MVELTEGGADVSRFRIGLDRLRKAQKSSAGAPVYSLYVNRPLGRLFAAGAYQVGLTPNQVTLVSALTTFLGVLVLALAPAGVLTGVAVAALLVLGYGLDAADGQLARLQGGGSLVGEWLDHVTDAVKVIVVHLAVAVCWFRFFDLPPVLLLVPLVFAAASSVHFFGMVFVDLLQRFRYAASGSVAPKAPATSRRRSVAKLPTDYGVLCLSFLLLGWHGGFVVVYGLLAVAMLGYTTLVVRKWRNDVEALERVAP